MTVCVSNVPPSRVIPQQRAHVLDDPKWHHNNVCAIVDFYY